MHYNGEVSVWCTVLGLNRKDERKFNYYTTKMRMLSMVLDVILKGKLRNEEVVFA